MTSRELSLSSDVTSLLIVSELSSVLDSSAEVSK